MIFSKYNVCNGESANHLTFKNIVFTVCFVAISIFINCAGSFISADTSLPLYLDSIMTIGVTAVCGLVPGLLCGFISNGILFLLDNIWHQFIICHMLTAFFAWVVFYMTDRKNSKTSMLNKRKPYSIDCFLWAGLFSAISNTILGTVICCLFFGKVEDRQYANYAIQGLFLITKNLYFSVYLAEFSANLTDKMLCAVTSFGLYEAVRRIYRKL